MSTSIIFPLNSALFGTNTCKEAAAHRLWWSLSVLTSFTGRPKRPWWISLLSNVIDCSLLASCLLSITFISYCFSLLPPPTPIVIWWVPFWWGDLTLIYRSPQGQKLQLRLWDKPLGFPALSHFTMATVNLGWTQQETEKTKSYN